MDQTEEQNRWAKTSVKLKPTSTLKTKQDLRRVEIVRSSGVKWMNFDIEQTSGDYLESSLSNGHFMTINLHQGDVKFILLKRIG